MRRRNAIEPVLGHMKTDGLLERNHLGGPEGDAVNALLCAIGHNCRLLLAWFRRLLARLLHSAPSIAAEILRAVAAIFQRHHATPDTRRIDTRRSSQATRSRQWRNIGIDEKGDLAIMALAVNRNGKVTVGSDCNDFIDELYEAAFLPDRWPAVLSRIGARIGSSTCTLITADGGAPHWVCPPDVAPIVAEYFASGWAERNDRVAMTARERRFGCVRDIDIWTGEEIAALPVVEQFLRPRGFGWGAAILTAMPTGETLMLSVERRWEAGPVPDAAVALLHALQPHLMRSALLSTKLLFERARAAVETFGLAAIPAAMVRASGAVIAANRLFEDLGGQLRIGSGNLLRPASPRAAVLLEAALGEPAARGRRQAPRSIAVPAHGEEERPLVLHVLPVEGQARDLFGGAMALLIVTRVAAPRAPATSLLEALFDLTRAEARVAQALLAGGSTDEIAAALGIRRETARNHLKAILRKTGFSRRMDLARFLSGVAVFDRS